jgi:hypothetical protein
MLNPSKTTDIINREDYGFSVTKTWLQDQYQIKLQRRIEGYGELLVTEFYLTAEELAKFKDCL